MARQKQSNIQYMFSMQHKMWDTLSKCLTDVQVNWPLWDVALGDQVCWRFGSTVFSLLLLFEAVEAEYCSFPDKYQQNQLTTST